MEAVLFQIVRALATVFEITLAFALLNAMFEPKYASKWPLRLSYILLLAAVFSSSARLTVISVKTAVEILLVFLVSLLVFRGRLSIKVFYNLIFPLFCFFPTYCLPLLSPSCRRSCFCSRLGISCIGF